GGHHVAHRFTTTGFPEKLVRLTGSESIVLNSSAGNDGADSCSRASAPPCSPPKPLIRPKRPHRLVCAGTAHAGFSTKSRQRLPEHLRRGKNHRRLPPEWTMVQRYSRSTISERR